MRGGEIVLSRCDAVVIYAASTGIPQGHLDEIPDASDGDQCHTPQGSHARKSGKVSQNTRQAWLIRGRK
jgi:hypothetical protein